VDSIGCQSRLREFCSALPEVTCRPGGEGGRHIAYMVRKKTFAYFTDDHHGDGPLALICKAAAGDQEALVFGQPARFFVPPYLGHRGWVGAWLDVLEVDWTETREMMVDPYRITAPKGLAALINASGHHQ
jgi:hypothetical protein